MDKDLFKSFLVKNGDTQQKLAEALGISLSNLNMKINGNGTSFRQNEIAAIKKRYKRTAGEVDAIFLAIELSQKDKAAKGARFFCDTLTEKVSCPT